MARWFRFLEKKRGPRRTGSNTLGRAGLGLFFAISFAVGIISLAFIVLKLSIPEWRVNHHFVETTCRVVETRIGSEKEGLTRPEIRIQYTPSGALLTIWSHYDIAGVYQSDAHQTEAILAQFTPGDEYPCWYDPRDPESVVLVRGYTWFAWLMLLLPAAFISIGGFGLVYTVLTWGKSTERLAAAGGLAPGLDFFLPTQEKPAEEFPFVPSAHSLNDSPGSFLAYRLPPGAAGMSTWASVVFCVLWNGVVGIFLVRTIQSFQRGEPDWLLAVFVVPFLSVGLAAIAFAARQLLIMAGVGPTLIEISAHPLVPGGEYDIFMSQAGQLAIKAFELKLICEEIARYQQGTNTRNASRAVYEQLVISRESFDIQKGLPYEARGRLKIPSDAMHSFRADHNRIEWRIVVKGTVARWPDFQRTFSVVVRPTAAGGSV